MMSINFAHIHFYDTENGGTIRNHNLDTEELQYISSMSMADYFFKIIEFRCCGTLFLW